MTTDDYRAFAYLEHGTGFGFNPHSSDGLIIGLCKSSLLEHLKSDLSAATAALAQLSGVTTARFTSYYIGIYVDIAYADMSRAHAVVNACLQLGIAIEIQNALFQTFDPAIGDTVYDYTKEEQRYLARVNRIAECVSRRNGCQVADVCYLRNSTAAVVLEATKGDNRVALSQPWNWRTSAGRRFAEVLFAACGSECVAVSRVARFVTPHYACLERKLHVDGRYFIANSDPQPFLACSRDCGVVASLVVNGLDATTVIETGEEHTKRAAW